MNRDNRGKCLVFREMGRVGSRCRRLEVYREKQYRNPALAFPVSSFQFRFLRWCFVGSKLLRCVEDLNGNGCSSTRRPGFSGLRPLRLYNLKLQLTFKKNRGMTQIMPFEWIALYRFLRGLRWYRCGIPLFQTPIICQCVDRDNAVIQIPLNR